VEYLRGAIGYAVGVGSVGQRGFDIMDVDSLAGPEGGGRKARVLESR